MIKEEPFLEITFKKGAYNQEKENRGLAFLENEKLVTEKG